MSLAPGVSCGECGEKIEGSLGLNPSEHAPCPRCGSMVRSHRLPLEPGVYKVRIGGATFKHKRPGRKKPLTEVFAGSQLRKAVGDYVNKRRVIDRENNWYEEHVETEAGEVLRSVTHPLSEHPGRGADKLEK